MKDLSGFTTQLRGLVAEEGLEQFDHRAKQVQELLDHPGYQFLTELIEAREQRLVDGIVPTVGRTRIPEHAELVQVTALIGGLRQLPALAREVVRIAQDERAKDAKAAAAAGEER